MAVDSNDNPGNRASTGSLFCVTYDARSIDPDYIFHQPHVDPIQHTSLIMLVQPEPEASTSEFDGERPLLNESTVYRAY